LDIILVATLTSCGEAEKAMEEEMKGCASFKEMEKMMGAH
jgi:hypothetical protein